MLSVENLFHQQERNGNMIPFIDLKGQYAKIEENVDKAIKKVLMHGQYILGPEVAELEKKLADFAGTKYCLGCSSGTDALLMAMMALGFKAGDAVFTTPFTFFATVETIALTGATPVFADVEEETFNMDPVKLREAILKVKAEGRLTPKAIVAVDIFGQCADYDAISAIAEEFDLPVIEDAAQSMGASCKGKRAPSFGKIGCTSFFPAKPLGCYGDGGAVFTDDKDLYDIMYSILVHGRGGDKYDNIRLGLNARLDTIQAAVLLEKLKIFEEEIRMRQQVAKWYKEELDGVLRLPYVKEENLSVWAQYCPMSPKFEAIQNALKEAGIPSARYYPIPMHLLEAMKYLGYRKGDMPVAERIAETIFALPMHPYLDQTTVQKIASVIKSAVNG